MSEVTRVLSAIEQGDRQAAAELLPFAAEFVKLRYFAGLTVDEAGEALGLSTATAYRHWNYARVWLHSELLEDR